MPCLFHCTQVKGMPPHTNDAERAVRDGLKRHMDAHVQFKSFRGMAAAARKMEIGANARNSGMPAGGAVTCAAADLDRGIFDRPPAAPPRPAPGLAAAGDGMTAAGGGGPARPLPAGAGVMTAGRGRRAVPACAPRAAALRPELPPLAHLYTNMRHACAPQAWRT